MMHGQKNIKSGQRRHCNTARALWMVAA